MTLSKMIQLALGSVGSRLAGAGISLITQLVLTRNFPVADVGVIFLAMSMAAIFSLIVSAGYPSLSLTQLPRFQALGLHRLVSAFHGAFLRDFAIVSFGLLAIIGLIVLFAPIDAGLRIALVFGALSAVPSGLMRYNGSLANTLRRYGLAFLPDFIFRPGLFFIYVAGAFALGFKLSLIHVLWVFIVSNTIVSVVWAWVMRADGLKLKDWNSAKPRLTAALRSKLLALTIVAAVTTLFSDVVTLIGGLMLPHEDVALLGLTIRLAGLAGFVIQASQQFVLNDLTHAITIHDTKTANGILMRMNLMTVATVAAALLGAIVFGRYFLSFFGPTYADGQWLLVLFILGQAVRAVSGMNQHMLSIGGYQIRSAMACVIGVVILVLAWALFQPLFGVLGVGLAVIAAEVAWGLIVGGETQKLTGRRGDLLWLLRQKSLAQL
jgi:O-antigen/teichoic acid export membrane protein